MSDNHVRIIMIDKEKRISQFITTFLNINDHHIISFNY